MFLLYGYLDNYKAATTGAPVALKHYPVSPPSQNDWQLTHQLTGLRPRLVDLALTHATHQQIAPFGGLLITLLG